MSDPVKIDVGDEIVLEGGLVAEIKSADGSNSLRVCEPRTSAFMDKSPDSPIQYGTQGEPASEERDSIKTCAILTEFLNDNGATWEYPVRPEGLEFGVDAIAHDLNRQRKPLHFQVIHALTDPIYWGHVARAGPEGVKQTKVPDDLAADLYRAILEKQHYPKDLVLVLNAVFTPGHADSLTVAAFRKKYTRSAQALQFKGIWVVGPTKEHVAQLDLLE